MVMSRLDTVLLEFASMRGVGIPTKEDIINIVNHVYNEKEEKYIRYGDLIAMVLKRTPEKGWTTDAMRIVIPMLDKVEKANEKGKDIELTSEEFVFLKERISGFNWGTVLNKSIIEFEDYINSVEK